jgi:lipase (class 3)
MVPLTKPLLILQKVRVYYFPLLKSLRFHVLFTFGWGFFSPFPDSTTSLSVTHKLGWKAPIRLVARPSRQGWKVENCFSQGLYFIFTQSYLMLVTVSPLFPFYFSLVTLHHIKCLLNMYIQVHHDIKNVQVTTFGQPRIGNAAFASYYSQYVPNTIRVTHEHDMVPHLPPYYPYFRQKSYHHFPREVCFY